MNINVAYEYLQEYNYLETNKDKISIVNNMISYDGNIELDAKYEIKFPFYEVSDFKLIGRNIKTLKHSPKIVNGNFEAINCGLISLENGPEFIKGRYAVHNNDLTNLKGSPRKVGGHFNASCNKLTSLDGSPDSVDVSFYISDNKLTDLKNLPEYIGKDIYVNGKTIYRIDGIEKCWLVGSVWMNSFTPFNELIELFGNKDLNIGDYDRLNSLIEYKNGWTIDKFELEIWLKEEGLSTDINLNHYRLV